MNETTIFIAGLFVSGVVIAATFISAIASDHPENRN